MSNVQPCTISLDANNQYRIIIANGPIFSCIFVCLFDLKPDRSQLNVNNSYSNKVNHRNLAQSKTICIVVELQDTRKTGEMHFCLRINKSRIIIIIIISVEVEK